MPPTPTASATTAPTSDGHLAEKTRVPLPASLTVANANDTTRAYSVLTGDPLGLISPQIYATSYDKLEYGVETLTSD